MSNQAIVPKTRKSEMVWNKGLGIYLLPKENAQPVVDINADVIIAKAAEAFTAFEGKKDDPIGKNVRALSLLEHFPELLRVATEQQKHIEIIKEENEAHLTAREELWRQEALNLAVMYEEENL